jgi:TolB-like protein
MAFVDLSSSDDHAHVMDQFTVDMMNIRSVAHCIEIETSLVREGLVVPGVSHIPEGSVRASGASPGVTSMLVTAEDTGYVWSKTLDHTLPQAANIQKEIASGIAESASAD